MGRKRSGENNVTEWLINLYELSGEERRCQRGKRSEIR